MRGGEAVWSARVSDECLSLMATLSAVARERPAARRE
jgi:hypothetical protein